ncbi:fibronectin type III domain-containing protein [Nitrosopumilus sp. S6]
MRTQNSISINKKIIFIFAFTVFVIGLSSNSFAYAEEESGLDAVTDIEFRTVTDFHTYLPDTHLKFDVSCNERAGEFAIGFNTYLQKANGNPADVHDVKDFVFLQRGSSETGALIEAVNTGLDRLKLTAEVTCAKLLPESLPTVPYTPIDFEVIAGNQNVTASWEEPRFDGNSLITKYEISAMPDPKTHLANDVFAETRDLEFTFDGLVNGITYKLQVNAVNEIGSGIKSEILTATPFVIVTTPTTSTITTQISDDNKVTLCHNGKTTLFIPKQAAEAHLKNHDDYLGKCSNSYGSSNTTPVTYTQPTPVSTDKVEICHNEKNTLSLPAKAARNHLENHDDDYLGQCTENSTSQLNAEKEAERLSKQEAKRIQLEEQKAQREAEKAQKEADRLAKLEAKRLQLEEEKAQREADRLAKLELKKQELEAKKQQLEEKQAKKAAERAEKETDRLAVQEAKRIQLEAEKAQREADRLDKQEVDKTAKEAERLASQEIKRIQLEEEKAQREAEKAAQEAERLAKQQAEQQQREAEKAAQEAERLAKQQAEQQQREAEKAQKEADRLSKLESKGNGPKSK